MTDREGRVRSYATAAEFDDFDRSPDEVAWEKARKLLRADLDVQAVQRPTDGDRTGLEIRGRLRTASHEAFGRWMRDFAALKLQPLLRPDPESDDPQAVRVTLAPAPARPRPVRPWLNIVLFLVTCCSTLFVGAAYGPGASELTLLNPRHWLNGWPFAGTLLLILGVHELGHFLAARYHRIAVTWPYFIPVPFAFGTLGAFIRLREPIRDRRKLFDVGAAGPLAGLVVAVPLLWIGLQGSELSRWSGFVNLEGNSLLYLGAKYLAFGAWLPDKTTGLDVSVNSMAFAAWIGLLATGLNLLPVGSLDGGHVAFSLFGDKARLFNRGTLALMAVLGVAGWEPLQRAWPFLENIGYTYWLFWLWFIALLMRPAHASTLDMVTELDPRRRWIGYAVLAIFVLTFVPVPFRQFVW